MRVLVTGVKGQLGHDVVNEMEKRGITPIGVDLAEMDITDKEACDRVITEAFGEKTLEELAEENKRLQEENERLKNRSIKERMYDKINVSVRTIDIFIGCMCVLFVAVVVMGMLK